MSELKTVTFDADDDILAAFERAGVTFQWQPTGKRLEVRRATAGTQAASNLIAAVRDIISQVSATGTAPTPAAQSAGQEAVAWRPVETAPKDGTWFLAWRKHETKPLMLRWGAVYAEFENADGDHVYHVTHWMPLPRDPNAAPVNGGERAADAPQVDGEAERIKAIPTVVWWHPDGYIVHNNLNGDDLIRRSDVLAALSSPAKVGGEFEFDYLGTSYTVHGRDDALRAFSSLYRRFIEVTAETAKVGGDERVDGAEGA